jgi:hypothetical protein
MTITLVMTTTYSVHAARSHPVVTERGDRIDSQQGE